MASKIDELNSEYVTELFYVGLNDENFFQILFEYLDFPFLTHDYEKKFWKECKTYFKIHSKPPTIGYLSRILIKEKGVRELVADIRTLDLESSQINSIIDEFENFIKESKFVEIFEKSSEKYNKGDQSGAFKIYFDGAKAMEGFSIKDKMYERVFADFEKRNTKRLLVDLSEEKVPFGIDELDDYCFGGPEITDLYLVMAESGVGKSQFLYHHAIHAARLGSDVAIFQIEGTKKQVLDRIDSAWSGTIYNDMKFGKIDEEKYIKLKRVIKRVRGEIFVESFEKFGGVTFYEIRKSAKELKKRNPNLKLILIDYLELMEVGDGINYTPNQERHRQQKLGKLLKELAMELKCVVGTVTQASNLPSELKKDPNFVMTREYLAEDKGKIRPFDFFMTLNQTYDEKRVEDEETGKRFSIMRILLDKMREYESGQVIKIANNFRRARFYDRKQTLKLSFDLEEYEE